MASFMCDFSCPRLCISVGSNTPMLPLGTIISQYIFQAATGELRRKMNQCNEMSISAVTRVWPTNSGITHLFNFEQHELALMYSHSKSDNVIMKYTQRKMSAQQSRREKRNTTASILLHRGKMVLLRQKKNKWCIHQLCWSYFKEIKY